MGRCELSRPLFAREAATDGRWPGTFGRVTKRTRTTLIAVLATVMALGLIVVAAVVLNRPQPPRPVESTTLREAVTTQNLMRHLHALQQAADANGGNRQAGSAGYAASVEYVEGQLKAAGYRTQRQQFTYPRHDPTQLVLRRVDPGVQAGPASEARALDNSGSGTVTADVTAADVNLDGERRTTSGCEASDFEAFPAGNIALLQRGTCRFDVKVGHATAAGASAVVIFNQGDAADRQDVFEGGLTNATTIPVVAVPFEQGVQWATAATRLQLTANIDETVTTENLIADMPGPDEASIVVGAHLDGVRGGPGVNDNASGVAATLEVALQLAELDIRPTRGVRVAFWSGEEDGLYGSKHYVARLDEEQRRATSLYLNLDMVGSPNPVPHVYGGFGAQDHPVGAVMRGFLAEQGLEVRSADFRASDHAPFLDAGIAVSGLYSGSSEPGDDGEPADPCYHRTCDRVAGVDAQMLGHMADALAHGVASVACDGSSCPTG